MTAETTSPQVASIAARYMDHEDPNVRALAASALSQAPDKLQLVAEPLNAEAQLTPRERTRLETELANLNRAVEKRRDEPGFAQNVRDMDKRISAIEALLAAE